jgi:hypothetical protein
VDPPLAGMVYDERWVSMARMLLWDSISVGYFSNTVPRPFSLRNGKVNFEVRSVIFGKSFLFHRENDSPTKQRLPVTAFVLSFSFQDKILEPQ